jgi:hypothetical protein
MIDIIVKTKEVMEVDVDERLLNIYNINKKPDELKEENIHKYTKYDIHGNIVKQYIREDSDLDTHEEGCLPVFHGKWRETTDEEITALNNKISAKRYIKPKTTDTEESDLLLQRACQLLKEKMEARDGK